MGDSVVSSIVSFAVNNLSRLLVDEVNLLSAVKDDITSLRNDLEFMVAFLKNSEGKRNNELVKVTVNQIREVAFQSEDAIDTYVVNVARHKSLNKLQRCFHSVGHTSMLHEVNDQGKKIKSTLEGIYKNKAIYGIDEINFRSGTTERAGVEYVHRRRRDVEEKEVVGLVNESNVVIQKLMESDPNLNVVSIIGMGGLGKTTLAKKIYNKDEVKNMFDCCAWSYVSNDYIIRNLLLSLLKCLKPWVVECKDLSVEELKEKVGEFSLDEYKDLDVEELKEKLSNCLKGKKYLVVLDDIWKTQVWDELKEVFPDDKNGSRIIITSRLREVALYSNASFVYELPFLDEEASWKLFSKKIFGDKECPCELEPLGRKMATSCKGLPLAVVVLAGLVAKKERSEREWRRIKDNVYGHLAQDKIVEDVLKLSYDDLSPELRPCFLYLGMYPEDYEIPVRELLRLWIAEGFIQLDAIGTSNAPLEPEDVAESFLDELVERSLVQVASRRSDGGVKTCRVHDLLRDLCILESRKNKFMEVCRELDTNKCNSRRMSFQYTTTQCWSTKKDDQLHAHTRSLLLFGEPSSTGKSRRWKDIKNGFKLARVLDMGNVLLLQSPFHRRLKLETWIHIRYLHVKIYSRSCIHEHVLDSICNLWNLETLHLLFINEFPRSSIPSKIWKLKSLRHVMLNYYGQRIRWGPSLSRTNIGDTRVENLQTLGDIRLDPETASVLNKNMFHNLTKLTLCRGWDRQGKEPLLRKILQCLNKLRKLKLLDIKDFPLDPNVFPSSLTKVTIGYVSKMNSRFIETLGQLPNLQILKADSGSLDGDVNCVAGDFPQLQVLYLKNFDGRWKIEEGAMPCIRQCNIPEGMLIRD